MNQNADFKYLNIGLPDDIARLKAVGDFANAIRLIDMRLKDEKTPEALAACMRVQREIMVRLPKDYPFNFYKAMARIREEIPSFTEEEFHALEDNGRIDWIFIDGARHYVRSFFGTLLKTVPGFAARTKTGDESTTQGEDKDGQQEANLLEKAMLKMQANGGMAAHIKLRMAMKLDDKAFVPGKLVKAYLPIPAKCIQQSNIKLNAFSHKPKYISPEDSPARTVYFEERLEKNEEFFVEFEYDHKAPYVDTETLVPAQVQPTFDTEEICPHLVFTPYMKELVAKLSEGKTNNLEKARAFYDFVTTKVTYSYMRDYFGLENIPELAARDFKGDCGVQAMLLITLCRCAGIPARWQSGLYAAPNDVGMHDWTQIYIAPYGWIFADPSFGGSAHRSGNERRRKHYFGNLDAYRMVCTSQFQQELDPPMTYWRGDPYDNQAGEMEFEDGPTTDYHRSQTMLEFREI